MKFYFAGDGSGYELLLLEKGTRNFLRSFFYMQEKRMTLYLTTDLLIDSGGFTAQKTGQPISVQVYADFLNKWNVQKAFNLDTRNIEESLFNQQFLEKETDCYIIPVYHPAEFNSKKHRGLIDEYVARYPYISVGGLVVRSIPREKKLVFLNYVFSKTRDKTKVHGLGVTSNIMLKRFPWYSVDSTSWQSAGRFGSTRIKKYQGQVLKVRNKKLNHKIRLSDEIGFYIEKEQYFTDLWTERGVIWE